MPGSLEMATPSSGVSVLALPWPCRTPPCVKLPADTMIMFVTADWICASIEVCAPVPSATIVMTAATPMIIPSIVSAVRILLRPSALSAIRRIIRNDIGLLCWSGSRLRDGAGGGGLGAQRRPRDQLVPGLPLIAYRPIRHDLAITELHDSRSVLGDVHLVRDEHDGDAALLIQSLKDSHHFDAGLRIEVPGRLVGEHDRGVVDQGARDRDALLLTARQLVRMMIRTVPETDQREHVQRALVALGRFHSAAAVQQRQLDVVERRGARQQVESLEHEPDFPVAHG